MAQIEQTRTARIAGPGSQGIPPCLILTCRKDGLEQVIGTPAFRLIENCAAHVFGMGARHVARNFRFQLVARAGLRRDLRAQSSVPLGSTGKVKATLTLVPTETAVIGVIERPGKIVMEIDLQKGMAAGRDRIVKGSQLCRDQPTQPNRAWRLRMLR